jgi:hypothetical protein
MFHGSSGNSAEMIVDTPAFGKARHTIHVIPAKAGIHALRHMALRYGFPPSRE